MNFIEKQYFSLRQKYKSSHREAKIFIDENAMEPLEGTLEKVVADAKYARSYSAWINFKQPAENFDPQILGIVLKSNLRKLGFMADEVAVSASTERFLIRVKW